jgi:protein-glutamine gamma-glutamyltransferase
VVLDEFDGTRWTSSREDFEDGSPPALKGRDIVQNVYLEPYGNKYLFALDKPVSFSIYKNKFSRTRIHPFKTKIFERIRYRATSILADNFTQTAVDRNRYVQLPDNSSSKVRELVFGLVANASEEEQVKSLVRFLQRGDYQYSLENLPVSATPFEDFLFVHKRGNCEFFASSLAVMLRIAGIPARLVGGYKGGHYNNTGRYYLVTQSNAHVWVEAYTQAHGWLRLDPTPPLQETPWHRLGGRLFLQLRLIFDTFNYYWYKVIIDYDFTKQLEILNAARERMTRPDIKLHIDPTSVRQHIMTFGLLIALPLLFYALFRAHKGREERIISKFLSKMAAYGYEKGKHEGLEEFIGRIDKDEIKDRARIFVEDFEQVYYRDRKFTKETSRRLRTKISAI